MPSMSWKRDECGYFLTGRIRASASQQRGKSFWGMPDRFWNRQQYWRTNIKRRTRGKRKVLRVDAALFFAVNAFVDLIKRYGQDEYDFSIRETQTYEIIEDVARMRSEIGLLFLNDFNETVLRKILKSNGLEFHLLFVARPHVFISRRHPLADREVITNEELEDYPYLSFEQGEHNSFYFSEEVFFGFRAKEKYQSQRQGNTFQSFDRAEWLYCMQRCH